MKTRKRTYSMTVRAEKAAATRQKILDSAVRLYRQSAIEDFTLDEIARRAGTTAQTVLRAFESKENLLIAALDRSAKGGEMLRQTPPGDVEAAVGAIFDIYETMGDLLMQRLADERRRPAMKPALDAGRASHRRWVEQVFAPLVARRGKASRAEMLDALTVATDVYVWQKLRRDMGLSRDAGEAVVRRIIFGAAMKEETNGEDSLAQLVRRREPAA
jgi:AcrR family transcriptional regulator